MSKVLKVGVVALLLFVAFSFGKSVKADEYSVNQDINWLYIGGYDYNSVYRDGSVAGVSWDSTNNIITVSNCNYTKDDSFISYDGTIPLTVKFVGTNTFKYQQNSNDFNDGTFIFMFSDSDIKLMGSGTVNLDHFGSIVNFGVMDDEKNSDLFIDGLNINCDGSEISTAWGNININNSKLIFNKSTNSQKSSLSAGADGSDPDGNGRITINNSTVEFKDLQEASFGCKQLVTNGYIYAGKGTAQYAFTPNTFLQSYVNSNANTIRYSKYGLTYAIFTNSKRNLPTYSDKKPYNNTVVKVTKPGKPSIKKLKNKKKKKVTVTWSAVFGADGYQLTYAMNKKFTKKKKTVNNYGTSKTVKKLKKKKTYFFKVRAFKNTSSGKLFGAWSAVKKVKIKK